jgi:aminobenzoyl-glutamate utilization protein B
MQANMEWLGEIGFSDEEQEMARALQRATGTPEEGLDGRVTPLDLDPEGGYRGSTDVADVSWVVPPVDVTITAVPRDIPWHAWGVVAASGSPMGHRGMLHAAKVLATTMVDLYTSPKIIGRIRAEFEQVTAGHTYEPYIPDGPPPPARRP